MALASPWPVIYSWGVAKFQNFPNLTGIWSPAKTPCHSWNFKTVLVKMCRMQSDPELFMTLSQQQRNLLQRTLSLRHSRILTKTSRPMATEIESFSVQFCIMACRDWRKLCDDFSSFDDHNAYLIEKVLYRAPSSSMTKPETLFFRQ